MRIWLFLLTFAASIGASGCKTPEPHAPSAVVSRASKRSWEDTTLAKLAPTEHQKARLDEVLDSLGSDYADYQKAQTALSQEIVRQAQAGVVDEAALAPFIAQIISEYRKNLPPLAKLAVKVHGILTPEQRRLLVGIAEDKDETLSESERHDRKQEELGRVLDLNAGQKTRLYPALLAIMMSHWGAVSDFRSTLKDAKEAFASDAFTEEHVLMFGELPLERLADAAVSGFDSVLGVLDERQRKTLVALIQTRLP